MRAGDVILVDLPPESLRRRIAAGRVYSAEYVGGALANYFRTANLTALSELARAWMEATVDEVGQALLASRGLISEPQRPTVIAGVSGSEWSKNGTNPADALAETARTNGASRVVVSRHRSLIGELLRGSVASPRRATVPSN